MNAFHIATQGILSRNALCIATQGFLGLEIVIPIPSFAGGYLPPWPGSTDEKRAIIIRIRPSWSHFFTTKIVTFEEVPKFSVKVIKKQVVEEGLRVRISSTKPEASVKVRLV